MTPAEWDDMAAEPTADGALYRRVRDVVVRERAEVRVADDGREVLWIRRPQLQAEPEWPFRRQA